jgi:hypothetical protein
MMNAGGGKMAKTCAKDIDGRPLDDADRLQLEALPAGTLVQHGEGKGKMHANCLAWVLMSPTMGRYRELRRQAGLPDDGGYVQGFIDTGILKIMRA